MTQNEVLEEAREISYLKVVEITYGANGYPKGLGEWAVIGFDDFEDAQEFADKFGCDVKYFISKDGWHFWNEGGKAVKPYSSDDYMNKIGDDYSYAEDTENSYYTDTMIEILERTKDDYEELTNYIKDVEEIKEKLSNCDNGQRVIVYGGKYYETIEGTMMNYSQDANLYAIGVFVPHNLK